MRTRVLGITCFAFLAALAMNLASAQEGAKIQVATKFRASHIVGMVVRNNAGKDLGTVKDLIVDVDSSHTRYVVLSFGGFAGFGSKLFAVPWQVLSVKFGERDHFFVYDVTEDQLQDSPGFDDNTWPNLGDPAWSAGIDKHFKLQPGERRDIEVVSLYRASTIKNMKVRNEANEDLGFVSDLVLDLKDGKIHYAALDYGSIAGLGGKLFAVPFQAFTLRHEGKEKFLLLDVSAEKLKSAPGFDSNRWPDMADPNWSRDIDRFYQDVRSAQRAKTRKD